MTHTKDKLAAALREVGLNEMADKAATGWYHDFLSPLDFPELTLIHDLKVASDAVKFDVQKMEAILELRDDVKNGEYDASLEESEEWANSPEGKEAVRSLMTRKL